MRRMINISPSIVGTANGSGWDCDKAIEKGTYLITLSADGWTESGIAVYNGEDEADLTLDGNGIAIGRYEDQPNRIDSDDPDKPADTTLYITRLY